jgi:hypothetical protein
MNQNYFVQKEKWGIVRQKVVSKTDAFKWDLIPVKIIKNPC